VLVGHGKDLFLVLQIFINDVLNNNQKYVCFQVKSKKFSSIPAVNTPLQYHYNKLLKSFHSYYSDWLTFLTFVYYSCLTRKRQIPVGFVPMDRLCLLINVALSVGDLHG